MPRSRLPQSATTKTAPKPFGSAGMFFASTVAVALTTGVFFLVPTLHPQTFDTHAPSAQKDDGIVAVAPTEGEGEEGVALLTAEDEIREVQASGYATHVPIPESVRAIYMTQCVVGTKSFREDLVRLIEETELNAVIIDIKDYTGKIAFTTDNPDLAHAISDKCGARDMKEFVATLHEKGIFVIGRITVFQDPYYSLAYPEYAVKFASPPGAVWKDHKGLSFIDVGAKPFWDYIVTLSREAHKLGFDELNYDYVRFPSDGPMTNVVYEWADESNKQVALEAFFAYLHKEMKNPEKYPRGIQPPILSADLFGMVTTNTDDLGIGQVLERALPYFDFIAPMVYPSHYPKGFNGWGNPNTVPYELIKFVLASATRRAIAESSVIEVLGSTPIYETIVVPPTSSTTATTTREVATGRFTKEVYDKNKIRPWLQDFNYGGTYGPKEVRAQIQATYDVGLNSWMLWAPSNQYTREALESAPVTPASMSE